MEVKKSPKADLQNKKGLFFEIGLVLSVLIMIGLFSWSKPKMVVQQMEQEAEIIEVEEIPQTVQEPPKVEQPKATVPVVTDIIDIVDDKIDVKTDMSAFDTEGGEDMEIIELAEIETTEEVVEEEEPLVKVEKMPTFQGKGPEAFRDWVQKNIGEYPKEAAENGISGVVVIRLTIGKDGSISDYNVMGSPDKSLTDKTIEVMKKAPKWEPGEQRGIPVPVYVIVRINFQLI